MSEKFFLILIIITLHGEMVALYSSGVGGFSLCLGSVQVLYKRVRGGLTRNAYFAYGIRGGGGS